MILLNGLIMNGSRCYKKKVTEYDRSSFLAQDNLSFHGMHFTVLKDNNVVYLIKIRGKRTMFMERNNV